jgi:hypothetical protein
MTREEQLHAAFRSRLDRLNTEIKARLTVKFINKQKDIRITFQPSEQIRVRCDETVSVTTLGSYLTNSFYELLIKSESNCIEEAYFVIKKVQAVIGFLKTNTDRAAFESEAIFSRANELVFLQNNDLVESFMGRFGDFVRFLQTSGPKMRRLSPSNAPEEIQKVVLAKLVALKIKTKALFAVALMFSDQKRHDVAIAHATKALRCGYSTLQLTLCIVFFKLIRKNDKLKGLMEEGRAAKTAKEIKNLENLGRILTSILDRIDSNPSLFKRSNKISATLAGFRSAYQERSESWAATSSEDIDLACLNAPQAIASSVLRESTILHLTNMTYIGFGQEVAGGLAEELTEQSIFEKVANVSVSFYILSVEHRFNEHNQVAGSKFYKSLMDYFNPNGAVKGSEFYLSKAVELAYLYLPDCFPFVSQILLVFKNFELNRSKIIPENGEDAETSAYLHPYRNGFKSSLIIPIIRSPIQWAGVGRPEASRPPTRGEAEFVSDKSIWKNFDKDPKSLIHKIYVPKQKVGGFKADKQKVASAVMRSPDLIAQKQLNAIKLKVFKGSNAGNSGAGSGPRDEPGLTGMEYSMAMSGLSLASGSPVPVTKATQPKSKTHVQSTMKARVGSSKITCNKENEAPVKVEKRANSSEITRMPQKDPRAEKRSAQGKLPTKPSSKTEFSLLKSTEFLFCENIKKVALKLRSNNENVDLNKKGSLVGQIRPNGTEKRSNKSGSQQSADSYIKDGPGSFFMQLGSQKSSPIKPVSDFKISGGLKAPPTVYFQNFVKNKTNIAEILSKFK